MTSPRDQCHKDSEDALLECFKKRNEVAFMQIALIMGSDDKAGRDAAMASEAERLKGAYQVCVAAFKDEIEACDRQYPASR